MFSVRRTSSYINMEDTMGSIEQRVEQMRPTTVEISSPIVPHPITLIEKWEGNQHGNKMVQRNRAVRSYYKQQQEDIGSLHEARKLSGNELDARMKAILDHHNEQNDKKRGQRHHCKSFCQCIQLKVSTAARLTLSANVFLFFIKMAATVQSGSLAVLSSLFDSGLDLFSGAVIAITQSLIRRYNRYHYPIGRNRLEPVAIIIIAAVMSTASLQVITNAFENLGKRPDVNIFSIAIVVIVIILKGFLYLLCKGVDSPSVQTLAVDHRNDVVSNFITLLFGLLGTYVRAEIDAVGGILIAAYIIFNWIRVGYEQLKNLVGHTADRRFINKLIMIAYSHDKRVLTVDTVRAYTFGISYLVEVDIQLDENMPLHEAHDIGESLQKKLESLEEVERAFVHLDFETTHSSTSEHKLP